MGNRASDSHLTNLLIVVVQIDIQIWTSDPNSIFPNPWTQLVWPRDQGLNLQNPGTTAGRLMDMNFLLSHVFPDWRCNMIYIDWIFFCFTRFMYQSVMGALKFIPGWRVLPGVLSSSGLVHWMHIGSSLRFGQTWRDLGLQKTNIN